MIYDRAYVKVRMEEMGLTLKRTPLSGNDLPGRLEASGLDVVRNPNEAYGYDAARSPLLRPTPKQIDEMEECLGWLLYVKDPRHRKVVFARACGVKRRRLLSHFKASHVLTITRWHNDGLDDIVAALNRKEKKSA